ncbi:MAG: glycosyltransferase, partial [Akkermansiaceae bacterium]
MVTPSFGQLDWLELCLASVRDQVESSMEQGGAEGHDHRATSGETRAAALGLTIEHIVCDGGSPGIEDFKQRMLERFPESPNYRLDFVIGPDEGMYDAINKGLRRANGEVCSYLNCDEQFLPGSLAVVAEFFQGHADTEVVFGDTIVVGREGGPLCYWR